MKILKSRFCQNLDAKNILGEYPRPNFRRESFLNLNGLWDCGYAKDENVSCFEKILVPFSPETSMAGLKEKHILQAGEYLFYRVNFSLPQNFNEGLVWLNFGAVDQECEVYINKQKIGSHRGGYLAFRFEISSFLKPVDNLLELRVKDYTEEKPYSRGKQRLSKSGKYSSIFYTPRVASGRVSG